MEAPVFTLAAPAEAGAILTLQRAAYVTEAQRYGDPFLPPLVETLDEVAAAIGAGGVLAARDSGRVVAAGRARQDGPVLHLGRLVVAPDLQGRGLGSALIGALEALAAPGTERFELFTGALSEPNLRLYKRLGYEEARRGPGNPGVELVYLSRPRERR